MTIARLAAAEARLRDAELTISELGRGLGAAATDEPASEGET